RCPNAPSVREDIPADAVAPALIVEDQFANLSGDLRSLPVAFPKPGSFGSVGRDRRLGGPDGVGRGSEVVSCDVRNRRSLSGGESCEPGRVRKSACCGVRGECCLPGVAHPHLTPDPGAPSVESGARTAVACFVLLKQVQDVLGTDN